MLRKLIVGAMVSGLLLTVGCASKKTDDIDSALNGLNGEGSDIVEKPLNFDPMGSDSGAISGLTTVYFDYDSSRLSASTRAQLDTNALWLKNNPGAALQVEGHTDARGSNEYNLTLGERRAQAVLNYLEAQGVNTSNLSVISYGEEKLMAVGDSDSDHSRNRRANFVPR